MKIAILISGRLKCYDRRLIPLLRKTEDEIHLFCSVNDKENEVYLDPHSKFYGTNPQNVDYDAVRKELKPWLKRLNIFPYVLPGIFDENIHPKGFVNIHTNTPYPKPWNGMSMFYNDRKAFEMATEYADDNGFEYDAYMKYRSDIITNHLPKINISDKHKIFSVVPWCNHRSPIVTRDPIGYGEVVPWVSDAIVYGNRKSMDSYTQTYSFCMEMVKLFDGKYPCNFEPSVTQNAHDKNLEIEYFNNPYTIDPSRHQ